MANEVMIGLFTCNILVKFAVTFVSIPGIYLVKEQPKGVAKSVKICIILRLLIRQ